MKRSFTLLCALVLVCVGTADAQKAKVKAKPKAVVLEEAAPLPVQDPKPPAPARAPRAPRAPRSLEPLEPLSDEDEEVSQQSLPAAAKVVVRLELQSGDIQVRGWDKEEVKAEAVSLGRVMLERTDEGDEKTKATTIEVYLKIKTERELAHGDGDCGENIADHVILNVPRGATLYLKTANGDILAEGIAEVNAETLNGDVNLDTISRYVSGYAANGDVSAANLTGRVTVKALSGDVSVYRAQPSGAGDYLKATAISGDVLLDRITHANVEASTVSGEILYQGALAQGGNYVFRTTSGDITAIIPAASSFKLNAKAAYGDISTDFALRSEEGQLVEDLKKGKLAGVCGKGDSTLTMTSFSGTILLRKK